MNKLIPIGLGTLLLIGIVVVLILKPSLSSQLQNQSEEIASPETTEQPQQETVVGSITGTINDLFSKNVPLSCTFSQTNEEMGSSGTIYLANNKFRGDFTTTTNNQESFESSMIQDGEYIYSWMSTESQGTKIKIGDTTAQPDQAVTTSQDEQVSNFNDLEEQNIEYDCQPWVVDSSLFTPPTEVNFIDLSQQMEKIETTTKDIDQAACNLCDQIPTTDEQDQCRQSLDCN